MEKAWLHCWDKELSMRRIRAWIERIPRHIEEVIRLKGGKEYREGRFGGASSIRPYDSEARKERYQRRKGCIRLGVEAEEEVNEEDKGTISSLAIANSKIGIHPGTQQQDKENWLTKEEMAASRREERGKTQAITVSSSSIRISQAGPQREFSQPFEFFTHTYLLSHARRLNFHQWHPVLVNLAGSQTCAAQ